MSTTSQPGRVVVEDGFRTWRILKPRSSYGKEVEAWGVRHEDRRYEEECIIHGDLDDALALLHKLEDRQQAS